MHIELHIRTESESEKDEILGLVVGINEYLRGEDPKPEEADEAPPVNYSFEEAIGLTKAGVDMTRQVWGTGVYLSKGEVNGDDFIMLCFNTESSAFFPSPEEVVADDWMIYQAAAINEPELIQIGSDDIQPVAAAA